MKPLRPKRPAARRPSKDAGFSLLEMMIALTVILIGLLSAYASELSSLEVVKSSRETNTASSDIAAAMEAILTLPAAEIPDSAGAYAPGSALADFDNYHLNDQQIVVSYPNLVLGQPVPDPLQIVLVQTWTDHKGRSREMRLASMKTR